MTDSHAERNAAQLRVIEWERSEALTRTHNALIGILQTADEELSDSLLDDVYVQRLEDTFAEIEAVADEFTEDDRIRDDRLLASKPVTGWPDHQCSDVEAN